MALQLFKEMLNGKYDGVGNPLLLPVGSVSGGKNMRKVSATGGWKVRKGCSHHNTTAIAAASVLSLHKYKHPRNADYHFIAQCNATLVDSTQDPPTVSGATFGTAITNGQTISASAAGFSDTIAETWVYADGGRVLTWPGTSAFTTGFLAYDNSETAYSDFTRIVTDNRASTEGICVAAASDVWYVCSPERAKGIILVLGGTKNATGSRTAVVKSWVAGAWDARVTAYVDGTSGTTTMDQSGTISWTANVTDTMRVIGGIMGYWYQISFSGALSNSIDIVSCQVQYDLSIMTNKWDGVFEPPLSVRFYDQSTTEYLDLLGKLSNESTSMYFNLNDATTSDFIYVGYSEPLCGAGLGVVPEYENTAAANFDHWEDWDGDSWNEIDIVAEDDETNSTDDTISLAQSGTVWWNAAGRTVQKRTMPFDSVAKYWYRLSWDLAFANAADDVRLFYLCVAPFPDPLPEYDGVIELKDRAVLWGDPEFPNRLRFSSYGRPDCFVGSDSCYSDAIGDMRKVKRVLRFYNELIIFKEDSVWMLEGFSPANFGVTKIADTVGTCAPKTAVMVEVGFPSMTADEPLTVVVWADSDGVYVLDGRKPRKVSEPVRQYFDTEYSTAIAAASLDDLQAFPDVLRNEYHLLIPGSGTGHGTELVYNYVTDEWYPPWDRTVGGANDFLVSGICLRGTDNRYYTYGGANNGRVLLLENDTADKNASDVDVIITHNIKGRAICFEQKMSTTMEFTFRTAWAEMKARTSGTITTNFYKDLATSATAIATPGAVSLVNSGYSLAVDAIDTRQENCRCFQLEFEGATADLELEIYSYLYAIEAEGELLVQ